MANLVKINRNEAYADFQSVMDVKQSLCLKCSGEKLHKVLFDTILVLEEGKR